MSEFEILHREDMLEVFDAPVVPPFLDIEKLWVRAPDGEEFARTIVRHPGAVAVAAMTDDHELILLRQYRASINRVVYELPAGLRDVDEELVSITAVRELEEETGYTATNIQEMVHFYSSLGFTDEEVTLFRATGLSQVEREPQGPEERAAEVVLASPDHILTLIGQSEIIDAKTLLAISLLFRELRA